MRTVNNLGVFHNVGDVSMLDSGSSGVPSGGGIYGFSYTFSNFFHPFVGDLIGQLNQTTVAGMLDPAFLSGLNIPYTSSDYTPPNNGNIVSPSWYPGPGPGSVWSSNNPGINITDFVTVTLENRTIDVAISGPYANYNWELLYHIPVMVAVHLSNNQRFAEAQKWFHLVFDPTSTDTSVPPPMRFWKSFVFRNEAVFQNINTLLALLSTPDAQLNPAQIQTKANIITGYNGILAKPFDPYVVARTRPSTYQWYVVMKYLDNLIAWGDSLFLTDTIETLNEATLCYVLAANILGPKPQAMPQTGGTSPKNFLQLKQAGLDRMSNALVNLEAQFPFNLVPGPPGQGSDGQNDQSGALFGIGRSLYFCIPQNQHLLAYWDMVADRLFKIRNSKNIRGVVQQLPLFDPPLDPGMLVKAAAAGIDIGSIVSGLNQPLGPVRSPLLIQKALEIAGEVRALGNALLASLEKGDAEQLALLRQGHEIQLQQMVQNVRFLQWQHAQETTIGLLKTRASALERYTYYLRLLGLIPDPTTVPPTFTADRRELTEANFDDTYSALVSEYDQTVTTQAYTKLQLAQSSSPSNQSGATGQGQLYLNTNEDAELNTHLPTARDTGLTASVINTVAASMTFIPEVGVDVHYWGLGGHMIVFGGSKLADSIKINADVLQIVSAYEQNQAGIASRTASYQRRADDWMFQANLAARELMQIGRQIIASLIAEQIAYHDYLTVKTQVQQAQDIQTFLQTKFTSEVFYAWMQSDISGLYYQYYRFACDTARKAEQTMKRELMRPELDATNFIQFNYWDTGHQGLLSGEALYLDIKRMEMAYHDNNKRELELTRHVSLRQLDPLTLLTLKITGSCTVTVPEWLYDRDCPGLYMRRIKSVSLSIPSVVGPYTSINCTVSLQSSTLRVSPLLTNGVYARNTTQDDDRFVDYFGATDVIVTSGGTNDSGMFETNLRDERFLPFEGAGAISTWSLSLPAQLRTFDYMTISDVILHIRYTAREAGDPLGSQATKELITMLGTAGQSSQALLFNLRYDFPTEWSAFINSTGSFVVTLEKQYFPYMVQSAKKVTIDGLTLYAANAGKVESVTPTVDLGALSTSLSNATGTASLILPSDSTVMTWNLSQQVFLVLQYHFGMS
jgi:Tc toxin complex TcA C-terminal TcB-binding domain